MRDNAGSPLDREGPGSAAPRPTRAGGARRGATPRMTAMDTPPSRDWIDVTERPLSLEVLSAWAARPHCGALDTRESESWVSLARARLGGVGVAARVRWPA